MAGRSSADGSGASGLGDRAPEDALDFAVARSRVANALFATDEHVRIGRYQLLRRAGAGGMGVVWSAWDPELDRRIAIKLMHTQSAGAREHMVREGQALAKLSHPNIVPIHDVGTAGEQVYLVMAWIEGETLRRYASEPAHSVRALVAVYAAAGAGIAAAHRAGIVHRDVKPDNVMIGTDGRVHLVDFGLAARGAEGVGPVGTPRYMAPEQARGEVVSPAADQYAFGVALGESLGSRGATPAWLAAIVARASAPEPAQRFPDMDALLAALARDPARRWRRRATVGGVLAAAAIAFALGLGTQRGSNPVELCTGAASELGEIWNATRRAEITTRLASFGPYGTAEALPMGDRLAAYGTRWAHARRGACLALRRAEVTPPLYERGLACLERARGALEAVATTLGRTTVEAFPDAVGAARDLPDPALCMRTATVDPVPPPREEVAAAVAALDAKAAAARYLALAADPAATAAARAAATAAAALDYAPLIARAQLALGAALENAHAPEASTAYATAVEAALRGGDDAQFVEAFARRLFVHARRNDPTVSELVAALPFVTVLATRTGEAGRFGRSLLANNAGTARLALGDRAGAEVWFRRAIAESSAEGSELATVRGNLAMVVDDRTERDALFADERARLDRALGTEHPRVLEARVRAALYIEDPAASRSLLEDLCGSYLRVHPHLDREISGCHYEVAWLAAERGTAVAARAAYAVVVAHAPPGSTMAITAQAELARLDGDLDTAVERARGVAMAAAAERAWWNRLPAVDAWLVVASAEASRGRARSATAALQHARAVLLAVQQNTASTPVLRRRARIDALLASATRDRSLAEAARVWYRAAGGYDAAVQALSW